MRHESKFAAWIRSGGKSVFVLPLGPVRAPEAKFSVVPDRLLDSIIDDALATAVARLNGFLPEGVSVDISSVDLTAIRDQLRSSVADRLTETGVAVDANDPGINAILTRYAEELSGLFQRDALRLETHIWRSADDGRFRAAQAERTGTDLVTVKVSKLFDHVLAHAAELGFANVTDACYDEAAGTLCSTDKAVQNSYLFFDGLHLTESGQRIQADYYRALLGQLDGSAHDQPEGMARFALGTMDQLAARGRHARFAAWAASVPQQGLSFSADAGAGSDSGSFAGLGVGWSDGVDWTFRLDTAWQGGGIGGVPGSSDFDGWSVVLSGERRWGDFRLGASVGRLSGAATGFRTMPVALMRADHDTDVDGQFAEIAAGYVLDRGALTIQPAGWLRWSEVSVGRFTERGDTGLEMAFDGLSTSGVVAGLGVDLRYAATDRITPWLSVSWEEAISGFDGTLTGRLVDNSAGDIARTYDLGGGAGEVRLGADIDLGRGATLGLAGWANTNSDAGAYAASLLAGLVPGLPAATVQSISSVVQVASLYGIGLLGLVQPDRMLPPPGQMVAAVLAPVTGKYGRSALMPEDRARLAQAIERVMQRERLYHDPMLSLPRLASAVGSNANDVSQVLNAHFGLGYHDYVARLRVADAQRILYDPDRTETLLEILLEVGFNSKSVFNAAFKRETGLTPSEFRRRALATHASEGAA
jgi:AraC-like DNA-binding protein